MNEFVPCTKCHDAMKLERLLKARLWLGLIYFVLLRR
jgi:hypothetical protein